jgi:predicted transcriptional regulator
MKQWELAHRAKGGARATHAICSEERNKVRSPLTLEEIERRLLEGRYARQMQEIINGSEYKDDRVQCYCAYA